MNLKPRQTQLLEALAAAGCTSPVSRQDIVDACNASGAYACPPSWLTQDSTRKVGRGLYDCPELSEVSSSGSTPSPAPAPAESTPVESAPVQGAVETVAPATVANLAMGMTGGERATLVPPRFDGYVAWGHFSDVEKIVRSRMNYNVYITGLSGNGKTLMAVSYTHLTLPTNREV